MVRGGGGVIGVCVPRWAFCVECISLYLSWLKEVKETCSWSSLAFFADRAVIMYKARYSETSVQRPLKGPNNGGLYRQVVLM